MANGFHKAYNKNEHTIDKDPTKELNWPKAPNKRFYCSFKNHLILNEIEIQAEMPSKYCSIELIILSDFVFF